MSDALLFDEALTLTYTTSTVQYEQYIQYSYMNIVYISVLIDSTW